MTLASQEAARGRGAGRRGARRAVLFEGSPLARKIIACNLAAILLLAAGMVAMNPFRDSLIAQREAGLVTEAELVAGVFEAGLARAADPVLGRGLDPAATLAALDLPGPSEVFVFDPAGNLLATTRDRPRSGRTDAPPPMQRPGRTLLADLADRALDAVAGMLPARPGASPAQTRRLADRLVARSLAGGTHVETDLVRDGDAVFAAATPIRHAGGIAGAVALTSGAGEIEALLRGQLSRLLELVAVAALVSIGLGLVLAATIARPLAALAAAAERGRARDARGMRRGRVQIPDLSARRDEIGRLSGALGAMVAALYDRIDANEQFAADVAHEIRNPLASLRSAVGSLRRVEGTEQRARMLEVIEHDVRRLDRLVSDISNASRLDSDLVRQEQESVDLTALLGSLAEHFGTEARARGIALCAELPAEPLAIVGLENRLAQVFVNVIGNALSFCGPGGSIRLGAWRVGGRIRIAIEDSGPGIPPAALGRIFERFYSERPAAQFGDNSGLGLAISKQIVEAHGGAIWAENVTPPGAGPEADPTGARFVIDLPE